MIDNVIRREKYLPATTPKMARHQNNPLKLIIFLLFQA